MHQAERLPLRPGPDRSDAGLIPARSHHAFLSNSLDLDKNVKITFLKGVYVLVFG